MPSTRRKYLVVAALAALMTAFATGAIAHTADSFEEAKAMAAEYAAPIVIDFYADW